MLAVVTAKRTVGRKHRVTDGQRNIKVSLREQAFLDRIADQVLAGESGVDVLRGEMNGVIVIPEAPGRLVVRVLVVLVEAGQSEVVCIAVELGK
ncbi:MAG: hypothetical protein JWO49_826 [Arthrobacter sp.]|nr:hypothetical protein [Arthrobacter sp.]